MQITNRNIGAIAVSLPLCALLFLSSPAQAQSPPTDLTELDLEEILALHIKRADDVEDPTRWSLGYRFVHAKFDGYRDGTDDLSIDEVQFKPGTEDRTADNFPIVPKTIHQRAHLVEIGYDVTEKWSVSLLLPFIHQKTDHISSVGQVDVDGVIYDFSEFTIESSGLGDIALSASHPAWRRGQHYVMATAGVSLPVGSIEEIGHTPREPGKDTQLPFTMQLGSGTFDLTPSLTYAGTGTLWSWGGQLRSTLRLGENDRDYRLGNRLTLTGWLKTTRFDWIAPSLKLAFRSWGEVHGEDAALKVPTPPAFPFPAAVTDPSKFGGQKLNAVLGATVKWPGGGRFEHHALELDWGVPLYQSLNGPQPKEVWSCDFGWH